MADHQYAEPPQTQPQDAFAELARITLADHSIDSVMEKIAQLAKSSLQLKGEVSITLVEGGRASTVAQTGPLALELDERQYERGYGPCLDCIDAASRCSCRTCTTRRVGLTGPGRRQSSARPAA